MRTRSELFTRFILSRILTALTVLSVLALGSQASQSDGGDDGRPRIDEYVRALESSYRGTRTLRAKFTQTHTWGNRTRSESGQVVFARGGLMRWDYEDPSPKLFLATAKNLILYVPAENQVTRSKIKSSEDVRVPFRLLLSRLNLRRVFSEIDFADGVIDVLPENRLLRAIPKKAEEAGYREVLMEITPAYDIRRLVITYADRSRMEFEFDQIQRNIALNPSVFRFIPPADAEIIDRR